MLLLNRYLRGEIIPAILLGLLFYTSLFIVRSFMEVAEMSLRHGIPLFKALFIILLGFPAILGITIPMAVLYGVLLSVAKMQSSHEILAFYSLGISKRRVMHHILTAGLGFVLLDLVVMTYLLPAGNTRLVRYRLELLQSSLTQNVQTKTFMDSFPGKVIFLRDASEDKRLWEDVVIFDLSQPRMDQMISSRSGELYMNPSGDQVWLKLLDTRSLVFAGGPKYQVNISGEQDILLYPPYSEAVVKYQKGFRERTMAELQRSAGSGNDREARRAAVELHKRLAIPATTLVFLLLGFALGLRRTSARDAGRGSVFVVSLLVILADYVLLTIGEKMAIEGRIDPVPALWSPVALFALLASMYAFVPTFRLRGPDWHDLSSKLKMRRLPKEQDLRRAFPFVLDGYLLRSWLPSLTLGMATITVLYVGIDFSQLADEIQRHHVPTRTVLVYYLSALPQIAYDYILPLAALVATALSLTALERNRELSALKSLGISWQRVGATFLLSILAFGGLLFFAGEIYLPLSNRKMLAARKVILAQPAPAKVGRFFARDLYLSGGEGWIYRYSGFDERNAILYNLHAFLLPPGGQVQRHLFCPKAQFQAGRWVTPEGWMRTIREGPTVDYHPLADSELPIPDPPETFGQVLDEPRLMNSFQLAGYIRALRSVGYNPAEWQVRFWQKIFYPWFLALLVLLSLVSTLAGLHGGSTWSGLGKSILAGLVLWAAVAVFAKLGDLGVVRPLPATLTPLIAFSALGVHKLLGLKS